MSDIPTSATAGIEADIETQREHLADTVDQLAHKLDVKAQAQERAVQLKERATTDDGHHQLHLIDIATGKIVPILVPPEKSAPLQFDAQRANWSPDGRRLVIEVGSGLSLDGPIPVLFNKLVDVADDGTVTGVTPFIHDRESNYEYLGTFTPDGRSLLFASQRGCEFQSWIAPLDNPGAAQPVAGRTAPGECGTAGITPYISPDGLTVLSAKGDGITEDRLVVGRRDGEATSTPITTDGAIAWQRLAP